MYIYIYIYRPSACTTSPFSEDRENLQKCHRGLKLCSLCSKKTDFNQTAKQILKDNFRTLHCPTKLNLHMVPCLLSGILLGRAPTSGSPQSSSLFLTPENYQVPNSC